jgi:plasmid stabilization system protein ParE
MLVIWSPQAIADLQEIWSYIAEDNPQAASKVVAGVRAKAEYLSRFPQLGRGHPIFHRLSSHQSERRNRSRHPWRAGLATKALRTLVGGAGPRQYRGQTKRPGTTKCPIP